MYYERKFHIMGIKGIYRKRLYKTRYGVSIGKGGVFIGAHVGKRSLYLKLPKAARKLGATWGGKSE